MPGDIHGLGIMGASLSHIGIEGMSEIMRRDTVFGVSVIEPPENGEYRVAIIPNTFFIPLRLFGR